MSRDSSFIVIAARLMSVPKIQWRREAGGTAVPYYKLSGNAQWRRYTNCPHRKPDAEMQSSSKGYATWLLWVQMGWEVISGVA
ncbi:MAG: hypothetical protein AAGG02_19960 [Cyanobacteria bacterium P01_H01_bin.15]